MSETTARQFNNYIRLPLSLLKLFPHGQAYVLGDVYSFTGERKDCHRTYKSFGERAGDSRATVARALSTGKTQGLISKDKEKGYIFNRDKINDDEFLRVLDWIRTEEFNVRKNERRRLLKSEISSFSYIYTHCDNAKKRNKNIEISISELAAVIMLSERTVQRAVWTLIRAGLIYRPKKDKGINAYKKSRYTLNYKLIRAHEKKVKAEQKAASPVPEPQLPKTFQEIEQEYRDKRTRAELIAERNLIRARENERFKIADDTYKYMSFAAIAAPYRSPNQKEEFERRAAKAQAERFIALQEIGLTEKDLEPQYECKLCNDTGQLENGARCSCFPVNAPPVIAKNVGAGELNK